MNTFEDRINNYKRLQDDMLTTFIDKDSDYGDSFGKTFEKYGIVSALIRMSDKMNRLDNLASNSNQMKVDESIEDTLLDLANYAMLTYLQIHKSDEKAAPWIVSEEDKKIKSVANKLNKVQAKGADDFAKRQLAVTKAGTKFHWDDTNETLELEETADYQAYMTSRQSLEEMVNHLYPHIVK